MCSLERKGIGPRHKTMLTRGVSRCSYARSVELYNALGRCYLRQGRAGDVRRMVHLASKLSSSRETDELLRASYLGKNGLVLNRIIQIVYYLALALMAFSLSYLPLFVAPPWIFFGGWSVVSGIIYARASQRRRGMIYLAIGFLSLLSYIALRFAITS
jgi:hypothetical protein